MIGFTNDLHEIKSNLLLINNTLNNLPNGALSARPFLVGGSVGVGGMGVGATMLYLILKYLVGII